MADKSSYNNKHDVLYVNPTKTKSSTMELDNKVAKIFKFSASEFDTSQQTENTPVNITEELSVHLSKKRKSQLGSSVKLKNVNMTNDTNVELRNVKR